MQDASNSLQAALAAIDASGPASKDTAMARGLMRGYHDRWQYEADIPGSVEDEFQCSIYDLHAAQSSVSRTWKMGGKIDAVIRRRGKQYVVDSKTTSEKIGEMDAAYWRQLAVESQVDMYLLAHHIQGSSTYGAIWDVIRKPGIRPKALTKAAHALATSNRTYCGCSLSAGALDHLARHGDEKEGAGLELYEHRVYRECTDNPGDYFQRKPVIRLEHEIMAFAEELWYITQELTAERRADRPPLRNSGSCMAYGRPCEYLGICSSHDTPESNNWQRRGKVHEELDYAGDGRNIITASRLRCWQTCKRKHYYRYELGIERVDREIAPPLYFGSLMHTALEAWRRCQMPQAQRS